MRGRRFQAYLPVMPQQNFRVQAVDDVQEFLSGRHEMTQGTEAWGEVARALPQIYYCIDWHET